MRGFASIVAGRRSKWVILAVWLIAVVAVFAGKLPTKLSNKTTDSTESFLPASAESTQVVRDLEREFPQGQTDTGLVVYQHAGGLTAADKAKIAADARAIQAAGNDKIHLAEPPAVPFEPIPQGSSSALVSKDGSVAVMVLTTPSNFDKEGDWGKAVRAITDANTGDMNVNVTGNLGFSADAKDVFSNIDTKLLLATVTLVLVLLGAIYRSALIALTPLAVVFFAYSIAQGLIYAYANSGATVSTNSTSILIVLMFGVGTDYCLLLVSRYREELRRYEDKHEAMGRAVRRAGPAILASGMTVALAMLVLTLADNRGTSSLGPVAAIAVLSALTAGLTLLPALLTIFGRPGFWPRRRMVAYDPEHHLELRQGVWRRFGDRVLQRPGVALLVTGVFFCLGALGLFAYKVDYSSTSFFKHSVESVRGFDVLRQAFPAGTLAPTTILVKSDNGPVTPTDITEAQQKLRAVKGVAAVGPPLQFSRNHQIAELDLVLQGDPANKSALDIVPRMRDAVANLSPGVNALVGGTSAINYDIDNANQRDLELIVPLALLVMAIILAILLQAAVAPLVLLASVIISFGCTLGVSILIIRFVIGDAGFDSSIPVFAFIFLVALGIDYTIFLMARVREEARRHGTREGMLRALAATGPVITSAGIILAGTFSVLMTLPVTFTFDLGLMVALGILLDTFIVRTIMVPAAVELLGDRVWWPSTARAGGRLREETGEHASPEPAEAG
ncbi:MAG: putative drug exporter of the superfamily [Solirubrobacterales bacterium]|nr:putative drug exporter of the superfamily [Solirubrobacterales bacterium]